MPGLIRQEPTEPFALTLQISYGEQMGKLDPLFLFSLDLQISFWLLDACGESGIIGILYFFLPELLQALGRTQTQLNKAQMGEIVSDTE